MLPRLKRTKRGLSKRQRTGRFRFEPLERRDLLASTARLHGEIVDTGGQPPVVTLFVGTQDAGESPLGWDRSIGLGTQSGVFTAFITDFLPETPYVFRLRV